MPSPRNPDLTQTRKRITKALRALERLGLTAETKAEAALVAPLARRIGDTHAAESLEAAAAR